MKTLKRWWKGFVALLVLLVGVLVAIRSNRKAKRQKVVRDGDRASGAAAVALEIADDAVDGLEHEADSAPERDAAIDAQIEANAQSAGATAREADRRVAGDGPRLRSRRR